jgi:hypothetical protein
MTNAKRSEYERLLSQSPFLQTRLAPDDVREKYATFGAMFALAVETQDDHEEQWAYELMKQVYVELMGDPPLDPDRGLPAGLWEAMQWMAKVRIAREQL